MKELRRHVYITPKSYLDLLNTYTSLLSAKRHELVSSRQRFVTGVAKLEDTKAMVASLQVRTGWVFVSCFGPVFASTTAFVSVTD